MSRENFVSWPDKSEQTRSRGVIQRSSDKTEVITASRCLLTVVQGYTEEAKRLSVNDKESRSQCNPFPAAITLLQCDKSVLLVIVSA